MVFHWTFGTLIQLISSLQLSLLFRASIGGFPIQMIRRFQALIEDVHPVSGYEKGEFFSF